MALKGHALPCKKASEVFSTHTEKLLPKAAGMTPNTTVKEKATLEANSIKSKSKYKSYNLTLKIT